MFTKWDGRQGQQLPYTTEHDTCAWWTSKGIKISEWTGSKKYLLCKLKWNLASVLLFLGLLPGELKQCKVTYHLNCTASKQLPKITHYYNGPASKPYIPVHIAFSPSPKSFNTTMHSHTCGYQMKDRLTETDTPGRTEKNDINAHNIHIRYTGVTQSTGTFKTNSALHQLQTMHLHFGIYGMYIIHTLCHSKGTL